MSADVVQERDRLQRENDWLRAYTGNSAKACVYCGLGAQDQFACTLGFPGCSRADDQMLCREVAVAYERDELVKLVRKTRATVTDFMSNVSHYATASVKVRFHEFLVESEQYK